MSRWLCNTVIAILMASIVQAEDPDAVIKIRQYLNAEDQALKTVARSEATIKEWNRLQSETIRTFVDELGVHVKTVKALPAEFEALKREQEQLKQVESDAPGYRTRLRNLNRRIEAYNRKHADLKNGVDHEKSRRLAEKAQEKVAGLRSDMESVQNLFEKMRQSGIIPAGLWNNNRVLLVDGTYYADTKSGLVEVKLEDVHPASEFAPRTAIERLKVRFNNSRSVEWLNSDLNVKLPFEEFSTAVKSAAAIVGEMEAQRPVITPFANQTDSAKAVKLSNAGLNKAAEELRKFQEEAKQLADAKRQSLKRNERGSETPMNRDSYESIRAMQKSAESTVGRFLTRFSSKMLSDLGLNGNYNFKDQAGESGIAASKDVYLTVATGDNFDFNLQKFTRKHPPSAPNTWKYDGHNGILVTYSKAQTQLLQGTPGFVPLKEDGAKIEGVRMSAEGALTVDRPLKRFIVPDISSVPDIASSKPLALQDLDFLELPNELEDNFDKWKGLLQKGNADDQWRVIGLFARMIKAHYVYPEKDHFPEPFASENNKRSAYAFGVGKAEPKRLLRELWDGPLAMNCNMANLVGYLVFTKLGFQARYHSGYLIKNGLASFSIGHAWIEVRTPDGKWMNLDMTPEVLQGSEAEKISILRNIEFRRAVNSNDLLRALKIPPTGDPNDRIMGLAKIINSGDRLDELSSEFRQQLEWEFNRNSDGFISWNATKNMLSEVESATLDQIKWDELAEAMGRAGIALRSDDLIKRAAVIMASEKLENTPKLEFLKQYLTTELIQGPALQSLYLISPDSLRSDIIASLFTKALTVEINDKPSDMVGHRNQVTRLADKLSGNEACEVIENIVSFVGNSGGLDTNGYQSPFRTAAFIAVADRCVAQGQSSALVRIGRMVKSFNIPPTILTSLVMRFGGRAFDTENRSLKGQVLSKDDYEFISISDDMLSTIPDTSSEPREPNTPPVSPLSFLSDVSFERKSRLALVKLARGKRLSDRVLIAEQFPNRYSELIEKARRMNKRLESLLSEEPPLNMPLKAAWQMIKSDPQLTKNQAAVLRRALLRSEGVSISGMEAKMITDSSLEDLKAVFGTGRKIQNLSPLLNQVKEELLEGNPAQGMLDLALRIDAAQLMTLLDPQSDNNKWLERLLATPVDRLSAGAVEAFNQTLSYLDDEALNGFLTIQTNPDRTKSKTLYDLLLDHSEKRTANNLIEELIRFARTERNPRIPILKNEMQRISKLKQRKRDTGERHNFGEALPSPSLITKALTKQLSQEERTKLNEMRLELPIQVHKLPQDVWLVPLVLAKMRAARFDLVRELSIGNGSGGALIETLTKYAEGLPETERRYLGIALPAKQAADKARPAVRQEEPLRGERVAAGLPTVSREARAWAEAQECLKPVRDLIAYSMLPVKDFDNPTEAKTFYSSASKMPGTFGTDILQGVRKLAGAYDLPNARKGAEDCLDGIGDSFESIDLAMFKTMENRFRPHAVSAIAETKELASDPIEQLKIFESLVYDLPRLEGYLNGSPLQSSALQWFKDNEDNGSSVASICPSAPGDIQSMGRIESYLAQVRSELSSEAGAFDKDVFDLKSRLNSLDPEWRTRIGLSLAIRFPNISRHAQLTDETPFALNPIGYQTIEGHAAKSEISGKYLVLTTSRGHMVVRRLDPPDTLAFQDSLDTFVFDCTGVPLGVVDLAVCLDPIRGIEIADFKTGKLLKTSLGFPSGGAQRLDEDKIVLCYKDALTAVTFPQRSSNRLPGPFAFYNNPILKKVENGVAYVEDASGPDAWYVDLRTGRYLAKIGTRISTRIGDKMISGIMKMPPRGIGGHVPQEQESYHAFNFKRENGSGPEQFYSPRASSVLKEVGLAETIGMQVFLSGTNEIYGLTFEGAPPVRLLSQEIIKKAELNESGSKVQLIVQSQKNSKESIEIFDLDRDKLLSHPRTLLISNRSSDSKYKPELHFQLLPKHHLIAVWREYPDLPESNTRTESTEVNLFDLRTGGGLAVLHQPMTRSELKLLETDELIIAVHKLTSSTEVYRYSFPVIE